MRASRIANHTFSWTRAVGRLRGGPAVSRGNLSHLRGSHDRKPTEIIVSMGALPTIAMTDTRDGTTGIVVLQNRMIKSAENVNISRFVPLSMALAPEV